MASSFAFFFDSQFESLQFMLEIAIAHCGHYYSNFFTFACHFEADNTFAKPEIVHFQNILKTLRLSSAQKLILKQKNKTFAWTVKNGLQRWVGKKTILSGRVLMIGLGWPAVRCGVKGPKS